MEVMVIRSNRSDFLHFTTWCLYGIMFHSSKVFLVINVDRNIQRCLIGEGSKVKVLTSAAGVLIIICLKIFHLLKM